MAFSHGDITFFLRDADRTHLWPIDAWLSCSVKRGKQPDGSIDIEVPRGAWWVEDAGLLSGAGGKGAMFYVECYFRDYDDPLQIGIVQNLRHQYGRGRDTLALECESLFGWLLRSRVIWEDGEATSYVEHVGKADDVLRAYLRENMVSATNIPASYPSLDRNDFGGMTVAVCADTASHPTTITFDADSGRNMLELAMEMCEKWDMRMTFDVSGPTATFDVSSKYEANDNGFAGTGKALSDQFGTIVELEDSTDYSPVRNTWCVRDGQNRSWSDCDDSVLLYGILEDVCKIQPGGAPASADMRGYELDHAKQDCTPTRAVDVVLSAGSSWIKAITHYGVADQVSVVCYPNDDMYEDFDIIGMELAWDAGGAPKVSIVMNDQKRSYFREAWRRQGPRGGLSMGSRFALGMTG